MRARSAWGRERIRVLPASLQEHGSRVPRTAGLGTMAGGITTARVDLIDGAFDQLAMTEQVVNVPGILGGELVEDLTLPTGVGHGGRGAFAAGC